VARSELAAAVLDRYEVTLDQAAVIAEFDDHTDAGTDAVKVLTVTAAKEPAQFEHVAQKLRDERADAALLADAVRELAGRLIMIVDPGQPGTARQISGLCPTAESPSGAELTDEAHHGCPGTSSSTSPHRRPPRRDAAGRRDRGRVPIRSACVRSDAEPDTDDEGELYGSTGEYL
jgi:ParB family chromosome partitioning protein